MMKKGKMKKKVWEGNRSKTKKLRRSRRDLKMNNLARLTKRGVGAWNERQPGWGTGQFCGSSPSERSERHVSVAVTGNHMIEPLQLQDTTMWLFSMCRVCSGAGV